MRSTLAASSTRKKSGGRVRPLCPSNSFISSALPPRARTDRAGHLPNGRPAARAGENAMRSSPWSGPETAIGPRRRRRERGSGLGRAWSWPELNGGVRHRASVLDVGVLVPTLVTRSVTGASSPLVSASAISFGGPVRSPCRTGVRHHNPTRGRHALDGVDVSIAAPGWMPRSGTPANLGHSRE